MENISIYIHWPWCQSKCAYCDFNSYAGKTYDESKYIDSIILELDSIYKNLHDNIQNGKICSIFFGGGTPSMMKASSIKKLIQNIENKFEIDENIEISAECNPASLDKKKMLEFKNAGINRLSIGVQSFNDSNLKFLGRRHSAKQAFDTVKMATEIFDNVNLDLIYGLPNQSLKLWKDDLNKALEIGISHISCYQLTIEPNTVFYKMVQKNAFEMPNIDIQGEFFEFTKNFLQQNNFNNYEVSNFAKKGKGCIHNTNIWNYNPYIGLGAGAHGRIINKDGLTIATKNTLMPKDYSENFLENAEILSSEEIAFEMIMLGLRLKEGINLENLTLKSKLNLEDVVNKHKFKILLKEKMLEVENNHLKLTKKSYHLLNEVIQELLL